MEPQAVDPIRSGFRVYSGRGLAFAVLGEENASRGGAYSGPFDDGLEQPAHGLFRALLDRARAAAPVGAAIHTSVDAPEHAALAGAARAIAGRGVYPEPFTPSGVKAKGHR